MKKSFIVPLVLLSSLVYADEKAVMKKLDDMSKKLEQLSQKIDNVKETVLNHKCRCEPSLEWCKKHLHDQEPTAAQQQSPAKSIKAAKKPSPKPVSMKK